MSVLGEIGAGLISLALAALLCAAWAAWRAQRPGKGDWGRAAILCARGATVLLGLAVLLLVGAFVTDRFELRYVAAHSSRSQPLWLKLSALWGGQEGSLLLWAFLQALLVNLVTGRRATSAEPVRLIILSILSIIAAFYSGVTLFLSSPFSSSGIVPADGAGLNPLLRHAGMALHPPALYLGYVGLAVPYASAVAALITGDLTTWTAEARRWTVGAWLFLGLGLLLGARWAYDVLGWGGYWGWDPVENAGLLPWLTATGLLHCGAMQERRRGFAGWSILLAVLSYLLVIFGTWATRSGAVQSVHAYAQSNLGGVYLAFFVLAGAVPLALLPGRSALLRSTRPVEEPTWPDWASLMTVALLLALTASILVGSLLPTVSEALGGWRVEAGPEWFDRVTGPQFVALVALLGVCTLLGGAGRSRGRLLASAAGLVALPLVLAVAGYREPLGLLGAAAAGVALGTAIGEFATEAAARARRAGAFPPGALLGALCAVGRPAGGRLVHVGVVCIAVGVIGTRGYAVDERLVLPRDDPVAWGGYTLTYEGLATDRLADYVAQRAAVTVTQAGRVVARLQPEIRTYLSSGHTQTVPAVRSGLREDLYIVLAGVDSQGSEAVLDVVRNPLIAWLWIGGALLLVGGGVALLPGAARRRGRGVPAKEPTAEPAEGSAGGDGAE